MIIDLFYALCSELEHGLQLVFQSVGTIEAVIKYIKFNIDNQDASDILQRAFGFLCGITAGNPSSCEIFVNHGGLELFLRCYETFSTNKYLVGYIFGTIANISEVEHLRSNLMKENLIEILV